MKNGMEKANRKGYGGGGRGGGGGGGGGCLVKHLSTGSLEDEDVFRLVWSV